MSHQAAVSCCPSGDSRRPDRVIALLVIVAVMAAAKPGSATLSETGQWTPSDNWCVADNCTPPSNQRWAVHLALLPGSGEPHSRVMFWNGAGSTFFSGAEWGWNPGGDGCGAYPSAQFTQISVPGVNMNVFCGGNTLLPDGRLFVPGGTDSVTGTYGENRAKIFSPGQGGAPGTWSNAGTMADWRWYPAAIPLRDGRTLVLAGSRHPQHRVFGGRHDGAAPSAPADTLLYRFAPVNGGAWELPLGIALQNPLARPAPREGHTFANMHGGPGFSAEVMFGGRDGNGAPLQDTWRLFEDSNYTGGAAAYTWGKLQTQGDLPDPRSEHTAIVTLNSMMVVFGGLGASDTVFSDLHRLFRDENNFVWDDEIEVSASVTFPTPRYGHNAISDDNGTMQRMIVFGGTTPGSAPSDTSVWELRFTSPTSATWTPMQQVDLGSPRPAPRFRHATVRDPRTRNGHGKTGRVAFVYGGELGAGAYSDSLWALWMFDDGTVGWELVNVPGTGPNPGPRARLTLSHDVGQGPALQGRLYLMGGENASGPADAYVYVTDPFNSSGALAPTEWKRWKEGNQTFSGHTVMIDRNVSHARLAEVFDPVGTTLWETHASATLLQQTYPPTFVIPGNPTGGGRVLSFAANRRAHWLDIPEPGMHASPWQEQSIDLEFQPQTGVLYRPGRIMIAGGENVLTGKTMTLNAASMSNLWVDSDTMASRKFHNLVLMPDGKVIVIGGVRSISSSATGPSENRPQIWDPDANGGAGTWTAPGSLAAQARLRNYHSTAILLPDGRVLSAGGDWTNDRFFAEIYCPPYLYKPGTNDLAPRPVINSTPASITWGTTFTVCVPDTVGIRRVAMIRPGVTTHAFDENQRYVPLTFTAAANPMRLLVDAPNSPDDAPPGHFLLFLTGSKEGTTVYPDVPSVAKWVRVSPPGRDTCDTVAPAMLADLNVDLISQNTAYLSWTAPADDGALAASGRATRFDLRSSLNPIDTETNWSIANSVPITPVPGPVATAHADTVAGLLACTWYHFAVRADDDNVNLSTLHGEVKAKTLCGGGGLAAWQVDPQSEAAAAPHATRSATAPASTQPSREAEATSLRPANGSLIVETSRIAEGGWQVVARRTDATFDASAVFVQRAEAGSAWTTLAMHRPGLDETILGLDALRDGGRYVIPGAYVIEHIAAALDHDAGALALTTATHSREGDLGPAFTANGGAVTLADGESVTLGYSSGADVEGEGAFLIVRRAETGGTSRRSPGREALPAAFALHQSQPNPARGSARIRFDLPHASEVRIEVFDLLGRRVRTLLDGAFPAGAHHADWNLRAESGIRVPPGVYVYRLRAGVHAIERKMVLAR